MIKKTKQEKKNIRKFVISLTMMMILLIISPFVFISESPIFLIVCNFGFIFNTLWMWWIGYSHGWELKRISMIEDKESNNDK